MVSDVWRGNKTLRCDRPRCYWFMALLKLRIDKRVSGCRFSVCDSESCLSAVTQVWQWSQTDSWSWSFLGTIQKTDVRFSMTDRCELLSLPPQWIKQFHQLKCHTCSRANSCTVQWLILTQHHSKQLILLCFRNVSLFFWCFRHQCFHSYPQKGLCFL